MNLVPWLLRSGRPWLLAVVAVLASIVTGWLPAVHAAPTELPGVVRLVQAQAALAKGWGDMAVPAEDAWRDVALPHRWTDIWPGHDGVVWYRIRWEGAPQVRPLGLLLEGVSSAAAVYLNGSLLMQDESLVEPLSMSGRMPHYWVLDAPLLHAGTNTLLVRVSGIALHYPGMQAVQIGAPAVLGHRYRVSHWATHEAQLMSMTVSFLCGSLFLVLWMFRREEAVFGWFALYSLAWLGVEYNRAAPVPWPLPSLHALIQFKTICSAMAFAGFWMFVLRLADRRFPRAERLVWCLMAGLIALVLLVPHSWDLAVRNLTLAVTGSMLVVAVTVLLVCTWRTRRTDQVIVAATVALMLLPALHDVLAAMGMLRSERYFLLYGSSVMLLSMTMALGWRLMRSLGTAEQFNRELRRQVDAAQAELAASLDRQRLLEVQSARDEARVRIVRDLHDGLGGALVSSIAQIESQSAGHAAPAALLALRQVRDELRLIIDSSARMGSGTLAEALPSVRHRMSRAMELQGIASRWRLDNLAGLQLPHAAVLDVLRILQEAVTNAMRHSGASEVTIVLLHRPTQLVLEVTDNGPAMPLGWASRPGGVGLTSMRQRSERLGGRMRIDVAPGGRGARLVVEVPLQAQASANDAGVGGAAQAASGAAA